MTLKEETGLLRGMMASTVLDQEQRDGDLLQNAGQEGDVGFGFELILDALEEDLAGEELNQTEDLVGTALAGGSNGGLLPFGSPGVAQRPHCAKLASSPNRMQPPAWRACA